MGARNFKPGSILTPEQEEWVNFAYRWWVAEIDKGEIKRALRAKFPRLADAKRTTFENILRTVKDLLRLEFGESAEDIGAMAYARYRQRIREACAIIYGKDAPPELRLKAIDRVLAAQERIDKLLGLERHGTVTAAPPKLFDDVDENSQADKTLDTFALPPGSTPAMAVSVPVPDSAGGAAQRQDGTGQAQAGIGPAGNDAGAAAVG